MEKERLNYVSPELEVLEIETEGTFAVSGENFNEETGNWGNS